MNPEQIHVVLRCTVSAVYHCNFDGRIVIL